MAGAQDSDDVDFLARRATERCRRGEYERALELFRQALDHGRTARALGEMGACELRVTRWTDAEAHLRAALTLTDDPWLRRHRGDAVAWLAEAQSHVGRLLLSGGVPGAEVRVGERVVATLPMTDPVVLAPGLTQVEVRAAGHRTWRRSIDVLGGTTTQDAVSLERDVVLEPSALASTPVACGPGSVLRLGFCYGTADGAAARRGVRAWQVVAWIGGTIAVVAGATALGFGAGGAADESAYLGRCGGAGAAASCVRDHADTQASLDDRAGLVNGLAGAAVVGVGLAVTALLIDRDAPRSGSVAIGPTGLGVRW